MKPVLFRAAAALAATSLLAAAIATATAPSSPANPLRVSLLAGPDPVDSFLGAVEVTITNAGSRTVRLPRWQLPLPNGEGQLFTVTRDGEPVPYIGRMVKWGVPAAADFAILRPGETRRTVVDLSHAYDLSQPGQYVVTYSRPLQFASLSGRTALRAANGTPLLLQSAPMQLWKDAAPAPATSARPATATLAPPTADSRLPIAAPMPGRAANPRCLPGIRGECTPEVNATLLNCTVARQDTIREAITGARGYAENAKGYLLAGNQGTRYTWWYGAINPTRQATARQNYVRIDAGMDLNDGQLTIDCACDPAYASAYAYVYPADPYRIYVCNAFWAAPMTGTDSRAGTLVHEMSHFTIVAGTNDWIYGQSGAHNLALSNPDRASGNSSNNTRGNADNYEYFSENTPLRD